MKLLLISLVLSFAFSVESSAQGVCSSKYKVEASEHHHPELNIHSKSVKLYREPNETEKSLMVKRLKYVEEINSGRVLADKKIEADWLPKWQTVRIYSSGGRIPADAKIRVIGFGGHGAIYSTMEALINVLRYFGQSSIKIKGGSTLKKIRNMGSFKQVAFETFDFIGHGMGPLSKNFVDKNGRVDVDKVYEYMYSLLIHLKNETPDLPFVAYAKSSGGNLVAHLDKRYPNLFDGVVSTGMPVGKESWISSIYNQSRYFEKRYKDQPNHPDHIRLNKEGMDFSEKLLLATPWSQGSYFNSKTPWLILTGNKDREIRNEERQYYTYLSQSNKYVEYYDLPFAGHDVVRLNRPTGYKEQQMYATIDVIMMFTGDLVVKSKLEN
ncbi:MAG: alpha/beta hydrolase family protein [Bdellovibrionales bacterium]